MSRAVRLVLVAGALAGALWGPGTPAAQQGVSEDHHFQVTWDAVPRRRGGVALQGYIVNRAPQQAGEFRVAVERLDEGGRTIDTTTHVLRGDIVTGDRLFFEVPVSAPAAGYRVRVVDFSWTRRGGGA